MTLSDRPRPDNTTLHERAAPMQSGATGPLAGVRVIDVTHAIAGPWAGMMLADLGADVIKVEPPKGEAQRFMGPFSLDDEVKGFGGSYGGYNRNKRSIALDLKSDEGRETLLELVDTADALIENQRAGVLDGLGLSYEVMAARNPRLVYGAVRGFGDPRTGESPYADWPAYDVIAQSMGGLVSMNGTAEGEQLKAGPFVGDIYPGTIGALAIVAALFSAKVTGKGQFVDVAMTDSMAALTEMSVMRYAYMGRDTPPSGNKSDYLVPFDIYETSDGSCAIAAPSDRFWAILITEMGHPELVDDPRTAKARDRVKNRELVDSLVAGWAASHTNAEIIEALGGRVPVGPVNDPAAMFLDPHFAARGMLVAVDQPSGRPVVQVDTPMRFSETPAGIYRRAPLLNEHDEEIRAELADRAEQSGGDA